MMAVPAAPARTDTARARGDSGVTPRQPDANARTVRAGDWIVRLDQPYSATVRTLLAIQKYKADDPPPYDDTGWTLDALRHVETIKAADSAILKQPMQLLTADASVRGSVGGSGNTLIVKHLGDWRSAGTAVKTVPRVYRCAGAFKAVTPTTLRGLTSSRTRRPVFARQWQRLA